MKRFDYESVVFDMADKIRPFAKISTTPPTGRPSKKELSRIKHVEWIVAVMQDYGQRCNGLKWEWHSPEPTVARGSINLLTLPEIYGDCKGLVYHGYPDEDPRLTSFKPVDLFAPDTCVGLYHDEHSNPELCYYEFGEQPCPLGIDIQGYFTLLGMTLGVFRWQQLLLEAAALPADVSYQAEGVTAQRVVATLAHLHPVFDLADFTATFRQLRRKQ